ncbi:hypothetical protein ABNX05_22005 [Lysinibacillus sp. M3]|uniref:Uncharacterized protein n=1 Tax=Lysinibacillus zambalensis TaxID=3160866 RepID=A0ABV1MXP8_9BACI
MTNLENQHNEEALTVIENFTPKIKQCLHIHFPSQPNQFVLLPNVDTLKE